MDMVIPWENFKKVWKYSRCKTIKVSDLTREMSGIYKINFPNGKIYIGQSSDIKRRMWEHNTPSQTRTPCDRAISKYGRIEEIEILEACNNKEDLNLKEIYWIDYYSATDRKIGYNITNGGNILRGEDSPVAKFSDKEVYDIRKRKFSGERKREVYNNSYSKYRFGTFEKVWNGSSYSHIGTEFKKEYDSSLYAGEINPKSKLTTEDVINIRKRYDNGEMQKDINADYPLVKRNAIRSICKRLTWQHI